MHEFERMNGELVCRDRGEYEVKLYGRLSEMACVCSERSGIGVQMEICNHPLQLCTDDLLSVSRSKLGI